MQPSKQRDQKRGETIQHPSLRRRHPAPNSTNGSWRSHCASHPRREQSWLAVALELQVMRRWREKRLYSQSGAVQQPSHGTMGNSEVPAHRANKTMRVHTSVQREGPAVQILGQLHVHPSLFRKQASADTILQTLIGGRSRALQ